MIIAMCEVKTMDYRNIENLVDMLAWEKTLDRMVKPYGIQWFKHIMRKDDMNVFD